MTHLAFELGLLLLASFLAGCGLGVLAKRAIGRRIAGMSRELPAGGAAAPEVRRDVPRTRSGGRGADTMTQPAGLPGPRGEKADALTAISGIGAQLERNLHGLGIFHFDQIAAWSPENVAWLDENLGLYGRIGREKWVEQALKHASRH